MFDFNGKVIAVTGVVKPGETVGDATYNDGWLPKIAFSTIYSGVNRTQLNDLIADLQQIAAQMNS